MDNQINNLLTEKQNLENSKILIQIQKEIDELEDDIKNHRIKNAKIRLLRVTKYLVKTVRMIAPYIVAAGITFGGFSIFGKTPFYRNSQKIYLEKMKEIDSLGNVRYEQQYDVYSDAIRSITYYSKWQKLDNGFYSRDILKYSVVSINKEVVAELFNENSVLLLQDVLGEPISKKTEFKNNLTSEEINGDSFLRYVSYDKDKNDFIIADETIMLNIGSTFGWLIFTLFLECLIYDYRKYYSDFDYHEALAKIKQKYSYIDVEVLKKKLEIKESNYKRLTR